MLKGNHWVVWGRDWQPHPLVLVSWAANCHYAPTPGQPRLVMGRELSCCFPFWNPKGGDGEVPCRGSAGAQCMGSQGAGVCAALSQGRGVGGSMSVSLQGTWLHHPQCTETQCTELHWGHGGRMLHPGSQGPRVVSVLSQAAV